MLTALKRGEKRYGKKKIKSAQNESEKKQTNSGQMEAEKETKSALKEKRDQ